MGLAASGNTEPDLLDAESGGRERASAFLGVVVLAPGCDRIDLMRLGASKLTLHKEGRPSVCGAYKLAEVRAIPSSRVVGVSRYAMKHHRGDVSKLDINTAQRGVGLSG